MWRLTRNSAWSIWSQCKDFLEERLARSVDVVTKKGLEPLIQDRVLREAETVF
jgi:predicted nucleotidyltransferase